MKLAFIGLGNMGYPMAGHLAHQGYDVTVFNRTTHKAIKWAAEYGQGYAATIQRAVHKADIIFSCVGNDDDLRAVTLGTEGVLHHAKSGAIMVDHSTVSAECSKQIAQLFAQKHIHFVDAPVSGGQLGAQKGQLSIMCGAETHIFNAIEPVLKSYGKTIVHMGEVGSGQLTKMVNQICVAGLLQGLAEGIYFAQQAGIDVHKAMSVISQGAASSWQMVNRYPTMLNGEYHFGFAVDWMRKDLDICLAEAAKNGLKLPVTQTVNGFYQELQQLGNGRLDTSSLLLRLQQISSAD
ncbi:NAD(P)-dependent oxidoreductase [Agitococcus lubricus]|uniref:3-hydroxyisobutyrate dehydrogenase/2-hydroxy-3-oxopropionate reductase n=1 Tax=Agitococcus lubricus TaxID=1077255 RepID=A0A2T5ISY7_9GAMM|nr:NAD(P)-dependent oxidoreductase [Agitococcus lubricus]PTQ86957.1 3-hydroxyisobutyrate dehydrogenase/2-hydroxy-3-oxopropionate reductase [Agitococcus lubricus]